MCGFFLGYKVSTKNVMIRWLQALLPRWNITNLTSDWKDGRYDSFCIGTVHWLDIFSSLLHAQLRPSIILAFRQEVGIYRRKPLAMSFVQKGDCFTVCYFCALSWHLCSESVL